jgi:hypothetical protein
VIQHTKQLYPHSITPAGFREGSFYLDGFGEESLGGKGPLENEVRGNGKNIPCPFLMLMDGCFPGGNLYQLKRKVYVYLAVGKHLYQREEYATTRARNDQDVCTCCLGLLQSKI